MHRPILDLNKPTSSIFKFDRPFPGFKSIGLLAEMRRASAEDANTVILVASLPHNGAFSGTPEIIYYGGVGYFPEPDNDPDDPSDNYDDYRVVRAKYLLDLEREVAELKRQLAACQDEG